MTDRDSYCSPRFSFEGVCEQLQGIVDLGATHFELDAEQITARACEELRSIRDSGRTGPVRWCIPEERPIRTKATNSYQPGSKGGLSAQAQLSFVWEIEKSDKRDEFSIVGLCSTKVTLVDKSEKLGGLTKPLAWTFEMGNGDSPGCHFHTQIDWKTPAEVMFLEADMHGWPSLDIPRLPSFLITPGDCLDYVLGELFQDGKDGWPQRYEDTDPAKIGRWLSASRRRVVAILKTSIQAAESGGRMSPWIAIKKWYPKDPKFLLS